MSLKATEFIRRFLLHIIPPGFKRIRPYGFLAPGSRTELLQLAKKLLNALAEKVQEAKEFVATVKSDPTHGNVVP